MTKLKLLSAGALLLALGQAPAHATPAQALAPIQAQSVVNGGVQQIQYRRHRRHGHWGRGLGIGLGIGVLGAIIANEAYRPRPGYYYDDEAYDGPYYRPSGFAGDPRRLCAQNFRSFEWNTGLYTTYSGEKRLCPYLG